MTDTSPITITLPPAREAAAWYDPHPEGGSGIHPAESCPSCPEPIDDGDPVRYVDGHWRHEACAIAAITSADGDRAWLLLADLISRRPSAFRASDIRAVMQNVARIARQTGDVA